MQKYDSFLYNVIYPIDTVVPDDQISCFLSEVIGKLNEIKAGSKDSKIYLNYKLIKKILYSLVFFKNMKYQEFIQLLDVQDPAAKYPKKYLKTLKEQQALTDTFIKGLLNRQVYNVVYVMCEKLSSNNFILLATMMWSLMQKKNIQFQEQSDGGSGQESKGANEK